MWRITPDNELLRIGASDADDVVWLPSGDMVFYRAELPLKRKQLWAQTVPFVLEEKLIGAVDAMHFAVAEPDEKDGVPVATLPLPMMEAWLLLLKEKNVKPRAMYPDFLAIPFNSVSNQPVLWHEHGRCFLRLGQYEGVSGSPEWVAALAGVAGCDLTARILSDDAQALPEHWRNRAELLPGSLEEQILETEHHKLSLNVLQGIFRPASTVLIWFKPWYRVAAALLVLASLYLAGMSIETRSLNAQTEVLRKVTERTFLAYFPEQQGGRDIRGQMFRLLDEVQEEAMRWKQSSWQAMVMAEQALSSCKACRVESMELDTSEVRLWISTSKDPDTIVQKLKSVSALEVSSKNLPDLGKRKQLLAVLKVNPESPQAAQ